MMIKVFDDNKDGKISFEEYVKVSTKSEEKSMAAVE